MSINVIGETPSIIEGVNARVYSLTANKKTEVCKSSSSKKVVNVSFFVKHMDIPFTLRVEIAGPYSSQTKDIRVSQKWERVHLPMRNDISLDPLTVFFTALTIVEKPVLFALEGFQVVERLFAGTPIGQGPALPATAGQGETLEASTISAKGIEQITSKSSTIMMLIDLEWESWELTETDFKTIFSLWSKGSSFELSIGVSGAHQARFAVREWSENSETILSSETISGRGEYFVCLTMKDNHCTLIVNGHVVAGFAFSETILFDEFYIGCTRRSDGGYLDSWIKQSVVAEVPYLLPRILQIYRDACPDHSHFLLDYMNNFIRLALVEDDELHAFEDIQRVDSFFHFVQQVTFSLSKVFLQFPPGSKFVEENVRDYVAALVTRPDFDPIREEYSKVGRTDLLLSYPGNDGNRGERYPIEFKIWGREGWKDAPAQPLKYMSDLDKFGVFVMIDRRKRSKPAEFEEIVKTNANFPCKNISKFPFLETNLQHFYSFHRDSRFQGLRVIANFYLPIPE